MDEHQPDHVPASPRGKALLKLTVGALGVVYGDIGTSPLYAIKESFHPSHGLPLTPDNIFGILSLVFWALTLIISVKYLIYILQADNRGEGGTMALLGLMIPILKQGTPTRRKRWMILLGLFGASLLYGDGIITPAISVLSAIEGLQIATPAFQPIVVPITVGILILLFATQRGGTALLGAVFGQLTFLWFVTLIATGLPWIIRTPEILKAINPYYAVHFFAVNGWHSYLVLGAVVLCITGGEALYADMGHFGKRPIRIGWFGLVFPALLINYFGQGALVLTKGEAVLNSTFYGLVDGWLVYPLVAIATAATITASQALISGAFSLTQQAVQLGYLPRMSIQHTSRETEGQIYVSRVNTLLMLACITLVLVFKESSGLAAMYGIAVTGTMAITSILYAFIARKIWKWPLLKTGLIVGLFLFIDFAFFGANFVKVHDGGWVPLVIAGVVFTAMTTWKRGRQVLSGALLSRSVPLSDYIEQIAKDGVLRVDGTAVFMTLNRDIAPSVLIHHVKYSKSLHKNVLLLSILTRHEPEIPATQRVRVTTLSNGFSKIIAACGYMESPDITEILKCCESAGLVINPGTVSFYLGRETILPNGDTPMAQWRKKLFIFFSRNARPATEYFKIPVDQVIEIGVQVRI